jgi:hypothetical protein
LFAKQLVRIFSLALGLEETALDQFFETPFTDITINHYPPQPDADEYKQVLYPHADYGGEYPRALQMSFSPPQCATRTHELTLLR